MAPAKVDGVVSASQNQSRAVNITNDLESVIVEENGNMTSRNISALEAYIYRQNSAMKVATLFNGPFDATYLSI